MSTQERASEAEELDVVIVGAGFAGIYALHRARQRGLRARVLEMGDGVGGTWYWNRYPGARCDVQSTFYSYGFDADIDQEWEWSERFATQPEIERYANFVVDRLGLRDGIRFDAEVSSARFEEETSLWHVDAADGSSFVSRFLIMATGTYSAPLAPRVPGADTFEGQSILTARWPHEPVDYAGKRVGVIGTGATGLQVISAVSKEPFGHLHVFQRTASLTIPSGPLHLQPDDVRALKARYPQYREDAKRSSIGAIWEDPTVAIDAIDDAALHDEMQAMMAKGSGHVFTRFTDLATSLEANRRFIGYLNDRVRARVNDPELAELLVSRDPVYGVRRVLHEHDYYEVYNRDDVTLHNAKAKPILEVTPRGVRTEDGEIELDIIIWAIGFDTGHGALRRIDVRGRQGISAQDALADGPNTYLGIMLDRFPNMFIIAGPGSPSIRSQMITSIEQHVEWVDELMVRMRERGEVAVETTPQAVEQWTAHVNAVVDNSLVGLDRTTQYFGANVPGKPSAYLAYMGGVGPYRDICEAVRDAGYEGFVFTEADGSRTTASESWSGAPEGLVARSPFGARVI